MSSFKHRAARALIAPVLAFASATAAADDAVTVPIQCDAPDHILTMQARQFGEFKSPHPDDQFSTPDWDIHVLVNPKTRAYTVFGEPRRQDHGGFLKGCTISYGNNYPEGLKADPKFQVLLRNKMTHPFPRPKTFPLDRDYS